MVGIKSYGVHVPFFRLSVAEIRRAWGKPPAEGERSVAYHNEDSITMAVNAAKHCLQGIDRHKVDGLYFASTTSPYQEKLSAATVAMASDLRRNILTADFTNSLRSGTMALRAAIDAVNGGSASNVLLVAADCRMGTPGSEFEQIFGDGAAALLIGNSDIIASIEGCYTHFEEMFDIWRVPGDKFVRFWDTLFTYGEGYLKCLEEGLRGILDQYGLKTDNIDKFAFYAPDIRRHRAIAKALDLDYKRQVQDPKFDRVGNTGSAFALMTLIGALEDVSEGGSILLGNFGDGVDAFLLKVTSQIAKTRERKGMTYHLKEKSLLASYERYLRIRDLIPFASGRKAAAGLPLPEIWRERSQAISFHGGKCKSCGTIQYPIQRVCAQCQTKDEYEEVRLSDKKGTIFAHTTDHLASTVDPPLSRALVDLEDGGRGHFVVTDVGDRELAIGMPVEMTFRNQDTVDGVNRYMWICRPMR